MQPGYRAPSPSKLRCSHFYDPAASDLNIFIASCCHLIKGGIPIKQIHNLGCENCLDCKHAGISRSQLHSRLGRESRRASAPRPPAISRLQVCNGFVFAQQFCLLLQCFLREAACCCTAREKEEGSSYYNAPKCCGAQSLNGGPWNRSKEENIQWELILCMPAFPLQFQVQEIIG